MKTMKKVISVLLMLCMLTAMCAAGAYADGEEPLEGEKKAEPAMTFDNLPDTMKVGDKVEGITVSGYSFEGITLTEGEDVRWGTLTSSEDSVIKPIGDTNNAIEAVGPGEATITATCWIGVEESTYEDAIHKFMATREITVTQPVTGITLTGGNITKDAPFTVNATVAPENATDKSLTWSVNPDAKATVVNGIVSLVSGAEFTNGDTITVTATANDGSGVSGSCTLTVSVPDPAIIATGLNITSSKGNAIFVGDSTNLTASVDPAGAKVNNLTWSSSDSKIATVNTSGVVTGVSKGTVTITASAEDASNGSTVTGTYQITVNPVKVNSIKLSDTTASIEVGAKKPLAASVLPENAENRAIVWTSDNTSVATVDAATGLVTAVKVGTANITATAQDGSNVSAVCVVTVKEAAHYRIEVTPNSSTLAQGGVATLTAKIVNQSGVNLSSASLPVTWSLSSGIADGVGLTNHGYMSNVGGYQATVLGKFNRYYTVSATCVIDGVAYTGSAQVTVSYAPQVVGGANAIYNGTDALSFSVNDSYQNFGEHVWVDNREVSNSYYSVSNYNGQLVVTLSTEFLNFLHQYYNNNGYHTLSIVTDYGNANSYFRTWGTASSFNGVKTGDESNIALWIALLGVSAVGIGAAVVIYKRRKNKD